MIKDGPPTCGDQWKGYGAVDRRACESSNGRGHRAMQGWSVLISPIDAPTSFRQLRNRTDGSHGRSCIEAGAVATATVGRVGEYEATTGPGRRCLVRSLAATAPGALRRRRHPSGAALARPLRTWVHLAPCHPRHSYCMARKGPRVASAHQAWCIFGSRASPLSRDGR